MMYAFIMSGKAKEINLMPEERQQLEARVRTSTTEQRPGQRVHLVLESAAGRMTREIARRLALHPAAVNKWCIRFSEQRISGLADAPDETGGKSITITPTSLKHHYAGLCH